MLFRASTLVPFLTVALTAPAFTQGGGGLQLQQRWDAPNPGRAFGLTYQPIGDIDGDGCAEILVNEMSGVPGVFSDTIHVLSGLSGGTIRTHSTTGEPNDNFGKRLADLGDVDGDGIPDYAISSPGTLIPDGAGLSRGGRVTVYSGATGIALHEIDSPEVGAEFGFGLTGIGDINGDGLGDFAVSAPFADTQGLFGNGFLQIFSGTGALLHELEGPVTNFGFGFTLAGGGDLDADGVPDLLSVYADGVEAYSMATGALLLSLDWQDNEMSSSSSLAFLGDHDGDGHDDFLVSEPLSAGWFASGPGKVHLYSGATGAVLRSFSGFRSHEGFGAGLSAGGDVDGDGVPDFAIGSPYADGTIRNGGIARYYSGVDGALIYQFYGDDDYAVVGIHPSCTHDFDGDGFADAALGRGAPAWEAPSPDGAVHIYSLDAVDPYLSVDIDTLDASLGGAVNFHIDFPAGAGPHYQLLASMDTGTPIMQGGLSIPLSPTPLLTMMHGAPPAIFSAPIGLLDAQGDASCSADFGPGDLADMAHRRIWFAAVAAGPGADLNHTSIPVGITVKD